MIKLIVGTKGSGKTKTLIDMINEATKTSAGNIVVIEKSMKLTTEINHKARLLDVDDYDITELFIDGILKVVDHDLNEAAKVLAEIDKITGSNVEVVVTVSASVDELPEGIKKYL